MRRYLKEIKNSNRRLQREAERAWKEIKVNDVTKLQGKSFKKVRKKFGKLRIKLLKSRKNKRKYLNRIPKSYNIYIKSKFWEDRKNLYWQKYGKKCQICLTTNFVHLHHAFYGDYGIEKDSNLVSLCEYHHLKFHKEIGRTRKDMMIETIEFIKRERATLSLLNQKIS